MLTFAFLHIAGKAFFKSEYLVLVKGLEPNENTIQKADEERIVLLGSEENTFDLVGKLYAFFQKSKEK